MPIITVVRTNSDVNFSSIFCVQRSLTENPLREAIETTGSNYSYLAPGYRY